jgi:hypothetical protein
MVYFMGQITAWGGLSNTAGRQGGSGTIYTSDISGAAINRTISVSGHGLAPEFVPVQNTSNLAGDGGRTWLMDSTNSIQVEELHLYQQGHVMLSSLITLPSNLSIQVLSGDGTGVLHLLPGQQTIVATPDHMAILANSYVYPGGRLQLPSVFTCYSSYTLIQGELSGVDELTIGNGCLIDFSLLGHTVGQPAGTYSFRKLTVLPGGELRQYAGDQAPDAQLTFLVSQLLDVRGNAKMHVASRLTIQAGNLTVQNGGTLYTDPYPTLCSSVVNTTANGITGGSGAGHGGSGGQSKQQIKVGTVHGDFTHPSQSGCLGGTVGSWQGGFGGGVMYINVAGLLTLDGFIHCNAAGGNQQSGGGSGGSIWIETDTMTGFGTISVLGGHGGTSSSEPGGGGGGGRIALAFNTNATFLGQLNAFGGVASNGAGTGGAGTVFTHQRSTNASSEYQSLVINNNNNPNQPLLTYTIRNFNDSSSGPGITWLSPPSNQGQLVLDELQVFGGAHIVVLQPVIVTNTSTNTSAFTYLAFLYLLGDRTGTVHVGMGQFLDLQRDTIDLPFNLHVYSGGIVALATQTKVYGITIIVEGVLSSIMHLVLHHNGQLLAWNGARTDTTFAANHLRFETVDVKYGGSIICDTDPVLNPGTILEVQNTTVRGGGLVHGTYITFQGDYFFLDDGGLVTATAMGYRHSDVPFRIGQYGVINRGLGTDSITGASGGGYGGSSGAGQGQPFVGLSYGVLFEPGEFGSAGGAAAGGVGARGGGMLWFDLSYGLHVDGQITADGAASPSGSGGGASGGSIFVLCDSFSGAGNITANGGNGGLALGYSGGGGGGGRIGFFFNYNNSQMSFALVAHGGTGFEPGGAGMYLVYGTLWTQWGWYRSFWEWEWGGDGV